MCFSELKFWFWGDVSCVCDSVLVHFTFSGWNFSSWLHQINYWIISFSVCIWISYLYKYWNYVTFYLWCWQILWPLTNECVLHWFYKKQSTWPVVELELLLPTFFVFSGLKPSFSSSVVSAVLLLSFFLFNPFAFPPIMRL